MADFGIKKYTISLRDCFGQVMASLLIEAGSKFEQD